jgi:hypothetical protein
LGVFFMKIWDSYSNIGFLKALTFLRLPSIPWEQGRIISGRDWWMLVVCGSEVLCIWWNWVV